MKPDPAAVAAYDLAVPLDPRARRGQMFGHPCAFVNGNMFFGTFRDSLIVRVGADRAAALAEGRLTHFEPMPGKPWREYVQLGPRDLPPGELGALAVEALAFTAGLPPKPEKVKKAPGEKKTAAPKPPAKQAGKGTR